MAAMPVVLPIVPAHKTNLRLMLHDKPFVSKPNSMNNNTGLFWPQKIFFCGLSRATIALGIIQYKFRSGGNYVNDDDDDDDDDDNDDGSDGVDDGDNDDCDDDDGGGCGKGGGDGGGNGSGDDDDDDDHDDNDDDDDDGNNLYSAFRGVSRHFQALSPPPECC